MPVTIRTTPPPAEAAAYVGVMPCGCWVAIVVDTGDALTRKAVAEFMRRGYTIERTTVAVARERLHRCVHRTAGP